MRRSAASAASPTVSGSSGSLWGAQSPNCAFVIGIDAATSTACSPPEEALADLDRALELEPDDVFALGGRGATYGRLNRYDEALADLDRALELEPGNALALMVRLELTS
jgi:tetratricopeptide (TPR) repeat protein